MPTTPPPLLGARDVLAMSIQPTLHAQRWSLAAAAGTPALGRFVLLASGRGSVAHGQGEMTLHPQDLVWLPAGEALALRVAPGSEGILVGVSEALLAAAIGTHAEAHLLRHVTGRTTRLTVNEAGPRDEIARSLRAIEAEARKGPEGSWGYLSAHLTIVLVWVWRLGQQGAPDLAQGSGGAQRLQRFRQLVEAQFREHWPVARYAQALAITPDRLHDLCLRSVGRPPRVLIHQRVVVEACRLLAGTDLAVEAIGAELGFGSASHFSRFFRRWAEVPPRAWREQVRSRARSGLAALPGSYADWP